MDRSRLHTSGTTHEPSRPHNQAQGCSARHMWFRRMGLAHHVTRCVQGHLPKRHVVSTSALSLRWAGTRPTSVALPDDLAANARDLLSSVGHGSVTLDTFHSARCLTVGERANTEDSPDVAVITLRNAARRNALSGRMMVELAQAVEDVESIASCKLLVLRGDGGTFCSGADLSVAKSELASPEKGSIMCHFMQHHLQRLRMLPMLTVASIAGAAVGGGAELSTTCDFRVMHESSFIQFVHTKMGVSPGWGGGTRLTRLVGRRHALRLLASACRTSATEAEELGLCDHVWQDPPQTAGAAGSEPSSDAGADPDVAAVVTWALPMMHGAAASLRGVKQVVAAADDLPTVPALDHERRVFASLWGGPAAQAALAKALKR